MIEIARILCPVDFSEGSERAFDYAVATARWYESRLDVLHVHQNLPAVDMIPSLVPSPADQQMMRDTEHARIQELAEVLVQRAADAGVTVDVTVQDARDVHRAIVDRVRESGADLLVMGTHGRAGLERVLLGSVADKVIRTATVPVLVVPPAGGGASPAGDAGFDSILCAVDFSEGSRVGLEYAISLAEEADADLTILHAIEVPPELREQEFLPAINIDQIRAEAEAKGLVRLRALIPDSVREFCHVHTAVAEGNAYREILRYAEERRSDLIVMGMQGRGALDRFVFGSNTSRVIRAAQCPVLVVPVGAKP